MSFKTHIQYERKLLEAFGFTVLLNEPDACQEIIGLCKTGNRFNFFIQIQKESNEPPTEQQWQRYQARVNHVRAAYAIEKDFLVFHTFGGKDNDLCRNVAFIKALVTVADRQQLYQCLGPVAVYFHEHQVQKASLSKIMPLICTGSENQRETHHLLQTCPFLKWDRWGETFQFLRPDFEYHYIAQEFNQYQNALYQGKFQQPFHVSFKKYIDFEKAPAPLIALNEILKKLDDRKKVYAQQQQYENAAWLRDEQHQLFNKWGIACWWDYSQLDLTQLEAEVQRILHKY